MVRQIESRLRRLEQEPGNKLPDVYVRDRYDGSVEAEIERGGKVEVVLVGWRPAAG